MNQHPTTGVYRFFVQGDRFVRLDPLARRPWNPCPNMTRAAYVARLVAEHVHDYEEHVAPLLETLEADEREDALEELYGLVCDLRPDLEIGAVRFDAEGGAAERDAAEPSRSQPGNPNDPERARRALRRAAAGLEARLAEHVIGQPDAIAAIARLVRRGASGLARRGPLARLVLAGPTGSGKTELARQLVSALGAPFELIRVDCSELAAGHEYSRLVGSPPGYVGHEQGGSLTERVANAPHAVVLFDEVEKAHPNLHRLLLQVLDEGRLTDGRGQTVDLSGTFVLMTSNCGTRELEAARDGLGFGGGRAGSGRGHDGTRPRNAGRGARIRASLDAATEAAITARALGEHFAPEFLARLDGVVTFRGLDEDDLGAIARLALGRLAKDVRTRGARLRWTPPVAQWLAARAAAEPSGARAIETLLARSVEPLVVEALLAPDGAGDAGGSRKHGRSRDWLVLGLRKGTPNLRREAA